MIPAFATRSATLAARTGPVWPAQGLAPRPQQSAQPRGRSVIVASGNALLRETIAAELRMLRWTVRQARGAAEIFTLMDEQASTALLLDSWLPDIDVPECVRELTSLFPQLDLVALDGSELGSAPAQGPFLGELLHALRQALRQSQAHDELSAAVPFMPAATPASGSRSLDSAYSVDSSALRQSHRSGNPCVSREDACPGLPDILPEFTGTDACMVEVSRRIQLVAHRKTTVLVHGPTGTGKELVARALHRLSGRPADRFVAINCAAIPESLIEAELFGHARGAFTGAVQARMGRIEAAAGGTLFLDEIGELPPQVQSKLLRFLESGEIQRVGENEVLHVDARVIAATHRRLGAMAAAGSFRLDLLHRLSVFLVQTPALAGRAGDIDALLTRRLHVLGREEPAKHLSAAAHAKLLAHTWPGNVRELEHTVERAWILAGGSSLITEDCIDFGEALL
jgi:DNA-binding NtrC family response regulator